MIAFRNLVRQDIVQIKMCFFVDGLDEFEGNYEEIAGLFKSITSPRVKVCLSGRPLLVFEDAFGLSPKLRLQDLTRQDIRRFVNEKLELHPRFRLLMEDRPRDARDLIMEVVTKADGVFLWLASLSNPSSKDWAIGMRSKICAREYNYFLETWRLSTATCYRESIQSIWCKPLKSFRSWEGCALCQISIGKVEKLLTWIRMKSTVQNLMSGLNPKTLRH
jgi:hypothetical protein